MNRFRCCALLISFASAWLCPVAVRAAKPTSAETTARNGAAAARARRLRRASLAAAHPSLAQVSHKTTPASAPAVAAPVIRGGPWTSPTFADSTDGDNVDGEDLVVRRAAAESLGPYNGSVVVVDPFSGRILSMVNQRVALGSGFEPCSTVKISVALAALSEKVIQPASKFRLGGASRMDLTYALAHSINFYFATLGEKMGFEKFSYYAHLFGYGEKAGLNVAGEQPGRFPAAPPKNGGVGMLTSFGEEIEQTPLQLAALMSAIANGGTLYYLQYPRTAAEAGHFVPQIKRRLEIGKWISDILPGMRGAVEFGTAHRAREDGPIAGKTGTCSSENHVHLGWFGSFNDSSGRKLVVVVLLTGGRPASGPLAAGIAGDVFRRLSEARYLGTSGPFTPASLVSSQICCAR
ncbi:MAG: penicillin-binding transpeptidase domain-containing protein [Bryobacteraceae bacterium]